MPSRRGTWLNRFPVVLCRDFRLSVRPVLSIGPKHAVDSGVVQLYVRLPTAEAQTRDMVRALSSVMVSARIDRGCGHVELTRDALDTSVLVYVEDWEDREQLEHRIRSERFGTLLGLMEACSAAPHLELRFVSEIQGLEYVASVREAQ